MPNASSTLQAWKRWTLDNTRQALFDTLQEVVGVRVNTDERLDTPITVEQWKDMLKTATPTMRDDIDAVYAVDMMHLKRSRCTRMVCVPALMARSRYWAEVRAVLGAYWEPSQCHAQYASHLI